jgi:hypothetical protein
MHLQAAILFAQEIGTFFALTAWNPFNSTSQLRHYIKITKIPTADLETMLFLCISIKNVTKSRNIVPFTVGMRIKFGKRCSDKTINASLKFDLIKQ